MPVAHAAPTPAAPVAPSGQPRIVIESHTYSPAQEAYQRRSWHAGIVFYKDVMPKGAHFMSIAVAVLGVDDNVPIRLALCYRDDGSEVRAGKATSLKILGDLGDGRPCVVPAGGVLNFSYRFPILSSRHADRKFCVKISVDARGGCPASAAGIWPAFTPGVAVLSQKKLAPDHPLVAHELAAPVAPAAAAPPVPAAPPPAAPYQNPNFYPPYCHYYAPPPPYYPQSYCAPPPPAAQRPPDA
jgi:hypothetical protein